MRGNSHAPGGDWTQGVARISILSRERSGEVLSRIIKLCAEEIPHRFGFHPSERSKVLTPMHRGIIGTINLNLELQRIEP